MNKLKKITVISLLLLVFLFNLGEIKAAEKVDLLLDWVPNTNHTGFYVAIEKGWYQEEGLELNIIQPSGNMSVTQVVGAGKAAFGISFQDWLTPARVEGVPVVSLAAIIQHNTSGFASMADKSIDSPSEFTNKRYGGWGMPIEKEILKSLVNGDGGNFEELKFINIGMGDLLTMLDKDKFDITWIFYGWDGIQAELRGLDLNVVMMEDYQEFVPDYYTPVIISSEEYIKENPKIVERFMRATARGYNFAIANPNKAAEILIKYTPESDPELVRKSQQWLSARYQDDAPYWGRQQKKVWVEFAQWMYQHNLIKNKFDAKAAFTNQFLPGFQEGAK